MAKKTSTKKTVTGNNKPPTKSQVFSTIAEDTELSRKQVAAVFDSLHGLIKKNLARGSGQFTLPGLCKMVVRKRPAQKPRLVRNPATGEMVMSKAKPASKTVRVRALKNLKEMV